VRLLAEVVWWAQLWRSAVKLEQPSLLVVVLWGQLLLWVVRLVPSLQQVVRLVRPLPDQADPLERTSVQWQKNRIAPTRQA
jgi:hypothetical protein